MPRCGTSAKRREAMLFYAGIAVLAFGLALALGVFVAADGEPENVTSMITNSKLYQHNLQLMGGRFGALLAEFSEWFGDLWHGRALATTIAVIAIVLAAACFVASAVVRSSASGGRDQR